MAARKTTPMRQSVVTGRGSNEMVRKVSWLLFGLMIFTFFAGASEGRADPLARPSFNDAEWRYDITPYIFLRSSVTGDSTVAGQTVSLDLDTSDLLDMLDFAISARFEAWKGDYGLILDLNYIKLGADATVRGPGPLALNADITVDIRQLFFDTMGSYRVVKAPYNAAGDLWTFEAMGGIRTNYLKQVVGLGISGGPGPGAATELGGDKTWVDPMFGIRVGASLNERWSAGFRADVGGFGVTDTDLTWSVTGAFDYRPWETTSLKFGYRYYSIDYASTLSDGAFAYDFVEHGPYVAATFSFQ